MLGIEKAFEEWKPAAELVEVMEIWVGRQEHPSCAVSLPIHKLLFMTTAMFLAAYLSY